jgi:hypothetical protein
VVPSGKVVTAGGAEDAIPFADAILAVLVRQPPRRRRRNSDSLSPGFAGERAGVRGKRLDGSEGNLWSPRALAPSPPPLSPAKPGGEGRILAGRLVLEAA